MATELKINENGQVPKNLTNNPAFAVIFTDYVTVVVVLFKVIPLKLFYYQTFFETWRNEHS